MVAFSSCAAPTLAPEGLNITSVESISLTLSWEIVSCVIQIQPITGYRLNYTYSNGTFTANRSLVLESRHYMLTGLTPFTNYSIQFHVAAINTNGTGPYADKEFAVMTLQDGELVHVDYRQT